ncbi:MAG: hypothetical protein AAFO29_01025 [Actinomycetota bacterium]
MTTDAPPSSPVDDGARAAWTEALDQFEQRLDGFRDVLRPDGEPPAGLWPPTSLIGQQLPPELAERARDLLDRARVVEAELVARRTELPPPQRAPVRHRRRPVSSTIFTAL